MTDKDRLLSFINHLVPDNFVCGDFSLTFNDDGSAFISIANPDDAEETEQIAEWINDGFVPTDNPGEYATAWKCSNCGKRITEKTAYCPGCGARMEVTGDA